MSCGCDGPGADQRHIGRQSNLGNELATPPNFLSADFIKPAKKEEKHEKDRTSTLPVSRDLNLSTSPKIKKTNDKNTEKNNQSGKKKVHCLLGENFATFFRDFHFGSWSFDF